MPPLYIYDALTFLKYIIVYDKGKLRENAGRTEAGPRQTDLGWVKVRGTKADPHKIAALPKSKG